MTKKLISLLALFALVTAFVGGLNAAETPAKKKKQTPQGLYLTAKEAYEMVKADPAKVLFVDTRTPEELYFVGYTDMIDKNIPIAYVDYTKIKEKKGKAKFASRMNAKFTQQIEEALKAKGLTKDDKIILICRSGSRSAKAAKILDKAGYKKVYTVVDGFEGDKDKQTHKRTVNGWKNAGLPWGYTFHKEKFILER
jgi:rhodanese-related sulfurtransferase